MMLKALLAGVSLLLLTVPAAYDQNNLSGGTVASSVVSKAQFTAPSDPLFSLVVPITIPPSVEGSISKADLESFTAVGGLLNRQLEAVTDSQVSLAIDPRILDSINALGSEAPSGAVAWMRAFLNLSNEKFALQYGDGDPTLLAFSADVKLLDFRNFAITQRTDSPTSGASASGLLGSATHELPRLLWPADGRATMEFLEGIPDASAATILLASSDTSAGLSSSNVLVGNRDVLVSNEAVSKTIQAAPLNLSTSSAVEYGNQVAASIASALLESPAGVIATLGRGWIERGYRLDEVVAAVSNSGLVRWASLSEIRAEPQPAEVMATGPSAVDQDRAKQVFSDLANIDVFSTVLVEPTPFQNAERASAQSALGVAWEDNVPEWGEELKLLHNRVELVLASVALEPLSDVNMASWQSTLTFTVRNDLPYPIAGSLHVAASTGRISLGQDVEFIAPANSGEPVRYPVEARIANGEVLLTATILDQSGTKVGPPQNTTINIVADWEGNATTAITIGIVLVFAIGLARAWRRKRARARLGHSEP